MSDQDLRQAPAAPSSRARGISESERRAGRAVGIAFALFGVVLLLPGTFLPGSIAEHCDRCFAAVAFGCAAIVYFGTRRRERPVEADLSAG